MYQFIRHTYKPVISAVNGYALAVGAGIVLSTDIRILSERAQLGWPTPSGARYNHEIWLDK